MDTPFELALRQISPRYNGGSTPWRSLLIHGAVACGWIVLLARALGGDGVLVWSVGLAYVSYDTCLLIFTFLATLPLARARPWNSEAADLTVALAGPAASAGIRPAASLPSLGVIVAAYNEARVLPGAIRGLLAQSSRPDQIIIADDGSDDDTPRVLHEQFGLATPALGEWSQAAPEFPGLHWLRVPRGGKARALNAAMVRMDVEVVVTVDADTVLDQQALAALRAAFHSDPALVAATGVLTPVCGPDPAGRVLEWVQTYEYMRNFLSRHAWQRADGLLLISGAFAGFRRPALLRVGGFDSNCLVEDYELIHRLRRFGSSQGLGWHTAVVPGAQARTEAPGTVVAFLRQRQRWFGGFLQTQFWYRDMVGDPRYGAVGTRMLPVKAIDTLQPFYGLTALAILLISLLRGHWAVAVPVAGVILAKIALDLAFHCWSVHVYRRWVGRPANASFVWALLAAILEPFTFQILRHTGAALGWFSFLSGRGHWGAQRRVGAA